MVLHRRGYVEDDLAVKPRIVCATLTTGVTLSYVEQGEAGGVPVVLLHAYVESWRVFDRLLPLLPRHLHVFAVDQRGCGDAGKPADGYSLEQSAADVAAFLDAVGVDAAVIVGTSSGGYVAQQLAVEQPHRVLALGLIGSPRSLHKAAAPLVELVEQLEDPVELTFIESFMAGIPAFNEIPADYFDLQLNEALKVPAHVWRAAMRGLVEAQPPTEAGTVTCPTLILWGGRDELLPAGDGERLAGAIPGSELVTYEDTGHLVLWEQPVRVAADLTAFIRRHH